ncbi:MAG: hypothetical protein OEW00_08945 [candidate division Zixibacteria bacterium]|nr:hypothetical protein [candidate division Zixibacteria bacterium]
MNKRANRLRWHTSWPVTGLLAALLLMVICILACQKSAEVPVDRPEQKLMQMLAGWWAEKDGIAFYYLTPMLLDMSLNYPNAFYAEMSKDTAEYNEFIDCLEPAVFTNLADTTTALLEQKRLDVLEQLKAQQVSPDYAPMQRRLIRAVDSIKVRYID